MKKTIGFFKKEGSRLIHDESGQGTTEYILMLVAVIAVVTLFRDKLTGPDGALSGIIGKVTGNISKFIN